MAKLDKCLIHRSGIKDTEITFVDKDIWDWLDYDRIVEYRDIFNNRLKEMDYKNEKKTIVSVKDDYE